MRPCGELEENSADGLLCHCHSSSAYLESRLGRYLHHAPRLSFDALDLHQLVHQHAQARKQVLVR